MRILAVTSDVSLLTALSSMMREWDIESVRDPADAAGVAPGAEVALVDAGSTERGLEAAEILRRSGVTIPCLVIGDGPPPAGARVPVLARPFTLVDLSRAVEESRTWTPPEVPPPTPVPEKAPEVTHEPRKEKARSRTGRDEAEAPKAPPEPDVAEAPKAPPTEAEVPKAQPEPDVAEELPKAVAEEPPAADLVVEERAAPEVAPPSPAAASPPPAPPPAQPVAPSPVSAVTADLQGAPEAKPGGRGDGALRRFLRRPARPAAQMQREAAPTQDPMVARLRAAIVAGRELESLLEEVSALTQPRAMAHAFLGGVIDMFTPQVAAVYAPTSDGAYSVIASHGLSTVEAGMKVMPEQPLFLEVVTGLQAILIAPVDLAQGFVAGIGGARTEALLAAPLEVEGICYGIAIVGRKDFSEFDLELLAELADEAAPGLAVAELVDRIRIR